MEQEFCSVRSHGIVYFRTVICIIAEIAAVAASADIRFEFCIAYIRLSII